MSENEQRPRSSLQRLVSGEAEAAGGLGGAGSWPPALRALAGLASSSPEPLGVAWGPQLVLLCNDALLRLLPLGEPGQPLAGEGPLREGLQRVLRQGGNAALTLPGVSLSLSAIPDGGAWAGVLLTAQLAPASGELLSRIGDEFRTPLTVLLGQADLLLQSEPRLDAEERERLLALRRSGLRLLRLIETLLELARASGEPDAARLQAVDLAALTRELVARFLPLCERAGVELQLQAPGALRAEVDHALWQQAALHLLSNAFKHTLAGRIEVRLSEEAGRAVLAVQDAGEAPPLHGLPPKARARESSGLGLLLVDRVARLHGGETSCSTLPAGGAIFRLAVPVRSQLPLSPAPPPPPSAEQAARSFVEEALLWLPAEVGVALPPGEPSSAGRVLVLDDDSDMRRYLGEVLSPSGEVALAATAEEARERIARRQPDLIVADARTCRDQEPLFLRGLRDAHGRRLPVLLLTDPGDPQAAALEADASEVLRKPFTARDIAARVGAQLAAARARTLAEAHRSQLYALFQQAPAAISVLLGPDHVFEMVNPRFVQIYRGSREVLGRTLREAMPDLAAQGFSDLLDRVYRTGEPFVGHEQSARIDRRSDGDAEEAFFTFVYQAMRDLSDRIEGVVMFGFEVTEQVRARRQIERLVAQAHENDKRKDEFLAMLAHELRNPLAPLRTSLELIRERRKQGQPIERHLEVVERQSENLARIVEDLLDVSRITRGKIALRRERLDAVAVVHQAMEATRPLLDRRRHEVHVQLPARPLWLLGDAVRLEQVLVNLLTNAAKYTDPGGRVTVGARRRGDFIELSVKDTGQGIPREMLPKVFDLFTQAARGLDRAQGGLGIGLTIVRNLVEMHGGAVEAISAGPGTGSEFLVRLPALPDAADGAAPQGEGAAQRAEGGNGRPASPARRRVLLVDDNLDAAETLAEFLEVLGHEVRLAHDGPGALRAALEWQADLVLLDIGLPGMDGYEVARELRKLPRPPGSVVALSGYGQEGDRKRSVEAGFDAHLVKPVALSRLEALLAGHIDPR